MDVTSHDPRAVEMTVSIPTGLFLFDGRLAYNEEWDETAELLLDAKVESNEF